MAKQHYISFIVDELRKGNVDRANVLAEFGNHWQKGTRSFDRYWKLANNQYAEQQQVIEKKKMQKFTQAELQALDDGIISKREAEKILSDIATNGKNSNSDRKQAIDTLSKLKGWNEPDKVDHTTKGNPLTPENYTLRVVG